MKYHKTVYPMHMPGHKGGRFRLIPNLYEIDVTEVPETDHLYQPEGVLEDSMNRLSEFYGSKKTVYLVNGSTVGIMSAIAGVHKPGDEILVARNCHQSVYHTLTHQNLKPHYITPKMTEWGLVGGIDAEDVRRQLEDNPGIVSMIITSPTYEGFVSDIEKIAIVCHKHGVILIVDEAHGAHFSYSYQLPESAVKLGADIVIHSTHKTLPTFTGSGLLHLNVEKTLEERILRMLQIYQTSSPSYVMMAQMDACMDVLGNNEKLWSELLKNIEDIENKARRLKRLYMLSDYVNPEVGIVAKDPLKNVVITRGSKMDGYQLCKHLRKKFRFQLEMASTKHVLAIFSVADKKQILNKYFKALQHIDRRSKKVKESKGLMYQQRDNTLDNLMLSTVLMPYETMFAEKERVYLEEAEGHVSACMITPYPPGIPLVVQGEQISKQAITALQAMQKENMDIFGLEDGCVDIVKRTVV